MPTVFKKDGFRFFFYSEEGNEPIHIHVAHGGSLAKFWLMPEVVLASNIGLKTQEIKKAKFLIKDNIELIKKKWSEYEIRRKEL